MNYIIITFQYGDKKVDLKIPAFVKIVELLQMLSEALKLPVGPENRLQAEPLGRILDNSRTLEQENVAQGSILTLI